jgi:hypothetical protein
MRAAVLFPLALVAVALTGCGGDVSNLSEREETASRAAAAALERDLTRSGPQIPAAEVASAIELSLPKPDPAPVRRHSPRPRPKPAPSAVAEPAPEDAPEATPEPVTVPAVSEALAEPATTDEVSAGGRELAPGRTVTVIPVSSGPSVEAEPEDSWLPSGGPRGILVGGGGTCRRRGEGGGIGIAARIRVGVPRPGLR